VAWVRRPGVGRAVYGSWSVEPEAAKACDRSARATTGIQSPWDPGRASPGQHRDGACKQRSELGSSGQSSESPTGDPVSLRLTQPTAGSDS
jgi:hypothetical protein